MELKDSPLGTFGSSDTLLWEQAGSHLEEHEDARPLLGLALQEIQITEEEEMTSFLIREVDMGRVIGRTACVPSTEDDVIEYRVRLKKDGSPARDYPSRFVVGRDMIPTTKIVVLAFFRDGTWVLITSYLGELAPREPWDAFDM